MVGTRVDAPSGRLRACVAATLRLPKAHLAEAQTAGQDFQEPLTSTRMDLIPKESSFGARIRVALRIRGVPAPPKMIGVKFALGLTLAPFSRVSSLPIAVNHFLVAA